MVLLIGVHPASHSGFQTAVTDMKKLAVFTSLFLVLTLNSNVYAQSAKKCKIGALTKSLANTRFLQMKEGYECAQKKFGLDVILGSTPTEKDDVEQLKLFQSWLAEGSCDGFVVTPVTATSLNSALTAATRKNKPIINVDELIPTDAARADHIEIVTRICPNNVEVGKLQAHLVLNSVPKGSDVAVIEGDPLTVYSVDRVTGFTNAVIEGGLKVVASQPANWNRREAYDVATKILTDYPSVKALFVASDTMAIGAIQAAEAVGAIGKVILVSVGGTPEAIDAVKHGLLAATVAECPDAMAYLAVEVMVRKLKGELVPEKIHSPIKLITKDNLSEGAKYYSTTLEGLRP
jgi:ABC-type sugar transport system substrate-binding protein